MDTASPSLKARTSLVIESDGDVLPTEGRVAQLSCTPLEIASSTFGTITFILQQVSLSIRYEFTESLRGCRIILIEGYRFAIKNMSKVNAPIKKIQWTCSTHGKHGCKAVVFTSRDEIIYLDNKHTHPPQTDKKSQNKYFLPISKVKMFYRQPDYN
ncbi:unnamed protein product [Chilo suppressalis]|uniref:FLYWCH-type domain-containing protein n=1 Tax=Chilo suppressalis TaxID=168631 RepID=A0ABN8AW59_CHISP|nr:unnamed protein product [Chilo suppressalis]